jgi:Flp pilus assembly protein TadG
MSAQAARAPDDGERGSAPVEFILVGVLLTMLTLGVLQFALAVHARNIVQDAAVDAAFHAALADTTPAETEARARAAVERGLGRDLISYVVIVQGSSYGLDTVRVHIAATLPLVGLVGPGRGTLVVADAPVERVG